MLITAYPTGERHRAETLRRVAKPTPVIAAISHPTQAEAVSASLSLRRHTGERTRAYRCPFCGLWHHGHTARRTKKVMRAKRGY